MDRSHDTPTQEAGEQPEPATILIRIQLGLRPDRELYVDQVTVQTSLISTTGANQDNLQPAGNKVGTAPRKGRRGPSPVDTVTRCLNRVRRGLTVRELQQNTRLSNDEIRQALRDLQASRAITSLEVGKKTIYRLKSVDVVDGGHRRQGGLVMTPH